MFNKLVPKQYKKQLERAQQTKFVIEDTAFHMPSDGAAYITDNTKYHNFFNGSEVDRVHLVATLLE